MSLAFLIYLAYLAGSLSVFLKATSIILLFGIGGASFVALCDYQLDKLKSLMKYVYLSAILFTIGVILPDTKTVYMMAAAEISQDALSTPEATKLRELINDKLDEALLSSSQNQGN